MKIMNRSSRNFIAYALVEKNGKFALYSGDLPIFWMRKIAKREADAKNKNGFDLHVEKVRIVRPATK